MKNNTIIGLIDEELTRSNKKHRDHFASTHEAYAVIKEEVEEFWEDVKSDNMAGCISEAVQIAAMAIKFLQGVGGNEI